MRFVKVEAETAQARRLIVTADDFGLSPLINRGIVQAHRDGIVTATALLVNAPATDEAVALAARNPNLQIGLHLGIVEGYALTSAGSSITDSGSYFGDGRVCLHRHWRPFLRRYLSGNIRFPELEAEFEAQIQRFHQLFPSVDAIPFLNSTQHLHILPGISGIVIRLCKKYRIKNLRVPHRLIHQPTTLSRRVLSLPYSALGSLFARKCRAAGIMYADSFAGFLRCGHQDPASLRDLVARVPSGTTELMLHPGFDDDSLRRSMPWAYADFDWSGEMAAACAPSVREEILARGISWARF